MQQKCPDIFVLEIPDLIEAIEVESLDEVDPTRPEEIIKQKTAEKINNKSNTHYHYFFDSNRLYNRDPIKPARTQATPPSKTKQLPVAYTTPNEFVYPVGTFKNVNKSLKATEANNFHVIHNHNLPGINRFFSFINTVAIDAGLSQKKQRDYESRIQELYETVQHGLIVPAEGKNSIKQLNPPIWYHGELIAWEAKRTDMKTRLFGLNTKQIYSNAQPPQAALAIDFVFYQRRNFIQADEKSIL